MFYFLILAQILDSARMTWKKNRKHFNFGFVYIEMHHLTVEEKYTTDIFCECILLCSI